MGVLYVKSGGSWVPVSVGVPAGGAAGDVLTKNTATDGDAVWQANGAPFFASVTAMKAYTGSALTCSCKIGTNFYAQCARQSTSDPWCGGFTASVTRSTDAAGVVNITAADVQMTTIMAATVTMNWSASYGTTLSQWASGRVSSNILQVKVWYASAASAGNVGVVASTSVLIYYSVYGVF